MLGSCCQHGMGITKDFKEAVKWHTKSAEQGNANAQLCLGTFYHFGQGVAQDYTEAVKWYAKSAEQGNAEAKQLLEKLKPQ